MSVFAGLFFNALPAKKSPVAIGESIDSFSIFLTNKCKTGRLAITARFLAQPYRL